MSKWLLTLHGPGGSLGSVETGEAQFVLGTETAGDVYTVTGAGVAPRHAWVWIDEAGMQVEDLAGGTLVNGHPITERVRAPYPVSVQVGGIMLVVEAVAQRVAEPAPGPPADTSPVPREQPSKSARDMAVTIATESSKPPTAAGNTALEMTVPSTGSGTTKRVETTFLTPDFNEAPLRGKYTLVKEIARGGMGQIHLGEDPELKRRVAVKVSTLAYAGDDPRFAKEAEVLAQLSHPNIVPIYARGVDAQGRPFYSMKLIKGRTLQAVLNALREGDAAATREYPRATLLTIFCKVCDALAFAHSKRILHRDLKPENIMVGEYGEVLVMDWGLAKVLGDDREDAARESPAPDTGDYGMTLEGEVMGTPQYMSPEQAQGMVADLDVRSDVYSLGGILYAILTLRPPVEGKTLHEVLTKVKSGAISAMVPKSGAAGGMHSPGALGREVPEALRAVTLKAMALDRAKRYQGVEAFSADIGAYQHGFATSAEEAGLWTQIRLWIARNRVLSVSTAVLIVVVSAFMVKVVGEGKKATEALNRLQKTAPTFNSRARDALEDGHFAEALESIDFAVDLEPSNADFHGLRGNILQVLERWPDAVDAYRKSLQNAENEQVRENLELTERLLEQRRKGGELTARAALFEALNVQGRRYEAMEFGKQLGDFWKERKRGQKDLSALADLVKRLESKLLPVPGTRVLMSKSEFTVGEWKLYLRAEGLPEWQQPDSNLCPQTDEHPVVNVNWSDAKKMCAWLSEKTGKTWRLPTNAEWSGAVGNATYPWGEHFPPNRDDGNYQILANGNEDPRNIGTDGVSGTAPVGSFKANALGFYDLGGNVWEWMWDATTDGNKRGFKSVRGGAWIHNKGLCRSEFAWDCDPVFRGFNTGFRIALVTANP